MRFTIKLKLAMTLSVIVLLTGVMAWLGISNLGSLHHAISDVIAGPAKLVQMSGTIEGNVLRIVRAEKNMLLAHGPDEIGKFDTEIGQLRTQLMGRVEKLQALARGDAKQKAAALADSDTAVVRGAGQDSGSLLPTMAWSRPRSSRPARFGELVTQVNAILG